MNFPPRLVVTGHDEDGRAVIVSEATVDNVTQRRSGHRSFVLWGTNAVPADADAEIDTSPEAMSSRSNAAGTIFRVAEYAPGVASARHQTDSVDYAIVLSGEIEMVLDEQTVTLRQGDTLVQRGTAHDWVNRGTEPCVIAFCLVAAKPRPPGS